MKVFRLAKSPYQSDLSGKGAEIAGGRWNSKGVALLYTSSSRALCMAEVLVHQPLGKLPMDFWLLSIELPEEKAFEQPSWEALPTGWNNLIPEPATKLLGDRFVQNGNSLGFIVPSALVQGDFNVLINPKHPDFSLIKIELIEPFVFDERLFRR